MQELEQIPALLQQLTTSKVAAAEKKLIAVSSSEEAIQYMVRMLDDPSLTRMIIFTQSKYSSWLPRTSHACSLTIQTSSRQSSLKISSSILLPISTCHPQ